MILDDIKAALSAIDSNVFYGAVNQNQITANSAWNYIVFGRSQITAKSGRTGYADKYNVIVVREDYIPDDLAGRVIDGMETIPGMRFSDNNTGNYTYERKDNTNITCEMLLLSFSHARRRCTDG